jgi:hypothetical protein
MAGSEKDDVIEGELQRKQVDGHWIHFIQDSHSNNHYIPCGSLMDIQLTQVLNKSDPSKGYYMPGERISGYFDERLVEPVEAYLVIGNFYQGGNRAEIILPPGTMVRVRK